MNPYLAYVQGLKDQLTSAEQLSPPPAKETAHQQGPKVLLLSPHPDDECLTGLLPLRLQHELGRRVVNIPLTFGSNLQRQEERSRELAQACSFLGWEIDRGRAGRAPLTLGELVETLDRHQPEAIFFPHERDWNSRHVESNELVREALAAMGADFSCLLVETEYWGAMSNPNLMVAGEVEMVADLVAATSLHQGEVSRNPYHLSLPFWMQDNVRRGSELVCGQGQSAPDSTFATLYRISRWKNKKQEAVVDEGTTIPEGAGSLESFFSSSLLD